MPSRAYVLLIDDAAGTVHLPVKAVVNRATRQPIGYCPGCPAIFGGKIEPGQTWQQTIVAEVWEESVKTYQVVLPANAALFYQEVVEGSPYSYYLLRRTAATGAWRGAPPMPPGAPLPPPPVPEYRWGEMQTVEAVECDLIPRTTGRELAQALVTLTDAHPTAEAFDTFLDSATLRAFAAFANR